MVEKTESICRTCLTESTQCMPIYESNHDYKLNELIKEFVGLDMQQQANLPSVICDICFAELMTVVNFISKCRASDEKLKEALVRNIPVSNLIINDIKVEPLKYVKCKTVKIEFVEAASDIPDDDTYDESFNSEKDNKKVKKKIQSTPFRTISCQICGLELRSKSALISHSRTHTGVRPFVCNDCNKSFTLKCTLKHHILRKHMSNYSAELRNFTCDSCGHRFYKKSHLKAHMRIHTKEKPYQCKFCPKRFSQLSAHIQHTRTHTGERPYPCHVCQKSFITRSVLKGHLVVHSNEKNFTCHICNRALKTRGSLRAHLLTHSSENKFPCEKCDKSFNQKMSLQRHMQTMHSELAGTCDICKKEVSNIDVHNRIHNGEKPFECPVCKKKFSRENYLKMHFKLHSEPTKFSCKEENCDAAFPFKEQLKVHEYKVHGSYFPYACKICSKGYYRKSDLSKHKIYGNCASGNIKREKMPEKYLKVE